MSEYIRILLDMDSVPADVKRVFRGLKDPVSGQQTMWQEVLGRAALDALGHASLVPIGQEEVTVQSAIRYFAVDPDLKEVMENAGLSIEVADFRKIMMAAVNESKGATE